MNGQRSVETLVDQKIPYSDMTDAEIESVIEYKAQIKSREAEYQERMGEHSAMMQAAALRFASVADKAEGMLQAQSEAANARLDAAFKISKEVRNG